MFISNAIPKFALIRGMLTDELDDTNKKEKAKNDVIN